MVIKPGIIEAMFTRYGHSFNYTKLWKNIDEPTLLSLLKKAHLMLDEIPILYFYSPTETGWLLTTANLFIFPDNTTQTLKLTDLDLVDIKSICEGTATKMECTSIQLFLNGSLINLETEVLSWPIIYQIFRFVIRKING